MESNCHVYILDYLSPPKATGNDRARSILSVDEGQSATTKCLNVLPEKIKRDKLDIGYIFDF